jgi:hypothetical protein
LVFIVVVVAGLLASFVHMLVLIATKQQLRALLPLPLGLVCAGFLVMVAWRRTVWSKPTESGSGGEVEAAQ